TPAGLLEVPIFVTCDTPRAALPSTGGPSRDLQGSSSYRFSSPAYPEGSSRLDRPTLPEPRRLLELPILVTSRAARVDPLPIFVTPATRKGPRATDFRHRATPMPPRASAVPGARQANRSASRRPRRHAPSGAGRPLALSRKYT